MAKEIERKFLVINDTYRTLAVRTMEISQGYLSRRREATVRVRIAGGRAYLTVKGPNEGAVRDEWEFDIPVAEAAEMLARVAEPPVLSKTRYIVAADGLTWEVDEFHGALEGLCVAAVGRHAGNIAPFCGTRGHRRSGLLQLEPHCAACGALTPGFSSSNTTFSTWWVCGNMSTGCMRVT